MPGIGTPFKVLLGESIFELVDKTMRTIPHVRRLAVPVPVALLSFHVPWKRACLADFRMLRAELKDNRLGPFGRFFFLLCLNLFERYRCSADVKYWLTCNTRLPLRCWCRLYMLPVLQVLEVLEYIKETSIVGVYLV